VKRLINRLFRRKHSYFVKMQLVYRSAGFTITHVVDWHEPITQSNYIAFDESAKAFFKSHATMSDECKLTIKSITKI